MLSKGDFIYEFKLNSNDLINGTKNYLLFLNNLNLITDIEIDGNNKLTYNNNFLKECINLNKLSIINFYLIPDIIHNNIKILELINCKYFNDVIIFPDSLITLYSYKSLINIQHLPNNLNNLILDTYFYNLNTLQWPTNLKNLQINRCKIIQSNFPINLEILHIKQTKIIEINELNNLIELELYNCSGNFNDILKNIKNFTKLKKLSIKYCKNFNQIQQLPNNLIELNIIDCNINTLQNLPLRLEILYIHGNKITVVQNLELLDNLKILKIENCLTIININTFPKNLQEIRILSCVNLINFPLFPNNVKYLEISNYNYNLTNIWPNSLLSLIIIKCNIENLLNLPTNLKNLKLIHCKNLSLINIENLKQLTNLYIYKCNKLKKEDIKNKNIKFIY